MSDHHTRGVPAATLALALSMALSSTHAAAQPAPKERCYGVALKGKNDCAASRGSICAGTARADHLGHTWLLVPKGSCEKTASKTSPTGFGQLNEFEEEKKT